MVIHKPVDANYWHFEIHVMDANQHGQLARVNPDDLMQKKYAVEGHFAGDEIFAFGTDRAGMTFYIYAPAKITRLQVYAVRRVVLGHQGIDSAR